MVAHSFDPSAQEAEASGLCEFTAGLSKEQFQDNQGYFILRNKQTNNKKQ